MRDIETMSGSHNHAEILIEDLRVPDASAAAARATDSARPGWARRG